MNGLATPQTTATPSTWNLDLVHSVAEFKVKHMTISNVKGQFAQVSGVLVLDEKDVANSRVEAQIDGASINPRAPQRDTHLKSADFFDGEKFPTFSFESTGINHAAIGEPAVTGDLTIHGVTRNVVFTVERPTPPAQDPCGNTREGPSAAATIGRKDFGLTWNAAPETGGILVGDEVILTLGVQIVKA